MVHCNIRSIDVLYFIQRLAQSVAFKHLNECVRIDMSHIIEVSKQEIKL